MHARILALCCLVVVPFATAQAQPAPEVQALTPLQGSTYLVKRSLTYGAYTQPGFTSSVELFRRHVAASSRWENTVVDTTLSLNLDGVDKRPERVRTGKVAVPARQIRYRLLAYVDSSSPVPAPNSTDEAPRFVMHNTARACDTTAMDRFFSPLGATQAVAFTCTLKVTRPGAPPKTLVDQVTYQDRGPMVVTVAGIAIPVHRIEAHTQQNGLNSSSLVYDFDTARGVVVKSDEIALIHGQLLYTAHTELLELPPVHGAP